MIEVFQFHKRNEKYLHHTHSGNKVLLLHDYHSGSEYNGIFEILTENHILFDVMEHWCMDTEDVPRKLDSYEVVVLPDISGLSDAQCQLLDDYVKQGGKLLVTGFTSTKDEVGNPLNKLRLKSLGAKPDYTAFEKVQGTYFRIFKKDKEMLEHQSFQYLDLIYAWEEGMLCEPKKEATGYLGFIPPAMIGPPEKCYYTEVTEIPGLIHQQFGEGQTAFITFRIGSVYHHKRHYGHAALVLSALTVLLDHKPEILLNASPMVEVSRQFGGMQDFEWYGLLNHTGQLGNGYYQPVPISNISLNFKPQRQVKSITSMKNEKKIDFLNDGNRVEVILSKLEAYDILLVEYKD
jgi:hypothetical protein